jgi:hypothetical protein
MTKLKERIHQIVDDLPRSELLVAERFLEFLRDAGSDPVLRALAAAPDDDETFTDDDAGAVREARRDLAKGDVVPHARAAGRRRR